MTVCMLTVKELVVVMNITRRLQQTHAVLLIYVNYDLVARNCRVVITNRTDNGIYAYDVSTVVSSVS